VSRVCVLVEGHGEAAAAGNLLNRLAADLGLPLTLGPPVRWKNLNRRDGIERAAAYARSDPEVSGLLILRDEDDQCPREEGPKMVRWLARLSLPFPSTVVLLHPEYEVLFLPCIAAMAGKPLGRGMAERPGLRADAQWEGGWESRRGVKEWLSTQYPQNRRYKPTTEQLALTQMIDFESLRRAEVPCFGTLERALRFLASRSGTREVYP
jgi:hypothetical protein